MVLMEDGVLSGSPLSVSIRNGWVLGQDSHQIPVHQVGIISESLCMNGIVIKDNRSGVLEPSAKTSHHEIDHPPISQPASHIKVLDR